MGSLKQGPDRITMKIEVGRLLRAPALFWNKEEKKFEKTTHTTAELLTNLFWLRLCKAHPELGDATAYSDMQLSFDQESGCIQVEFIKFPPMKDRE
jgi:hypothetical protein